MLERVDGEGDGRARGLRDLREQQTDRAAARDRHAGADADVAEVDRVDGDAERLEQRARHAVHRAGQRVQAVGRPRQVLLQPAVAVPWPANRTFGQRFGWPSRHWSQRSHGIAGSTATRRPASGPSSTTPASS